MSTADVPQLARLIEALSVDAINLALRFAEEYDRELAQLADALTPITAALGPAAAALFPARLEVSTYEVSTRVQVIVERTRGAGVKLVPLNLGYDLRYGTTATRESRIRIRVARIPLPAVPLGTRGGTQGDRDAAAGEPSGQ